MKKETLAVKDIKLPAYDTFSSDLAEIKISKATRAQVLANIYGNIPSYILKSKMTIHALNFYS